MADGTVTLVLAGRGSLTFPEGRRYRRVVAGEAFAVDATTAAVLLATDPAVSIVEVAAIPLAPVLATASVPVAAVPWSPEVTPASEPKLASVKVPELVAIAEGLGLTVAKRARKDEVIAAIEAEQARLAAEAAEAAALATLAKAVRAEAAAEVDAEPVAVPVAPGPDVEDDPTIGRQTDLAALTGAVTIADLPDGAKLAPERL